MTLFAAIQRRDMVVRLTERFLAIVASYTVVENIGMSETIAQEAAGVVTHVALVRCRNMAAGFTDGRAAVMTS